MNLPEFLRIVDSKASNMTQEQLMIFVHNLARTLPESKRLDFLTKLSNVNDISDTEKVVSEIEKDKIKELRINVEQIKQKLSLVKKGDLCLSGYLNEEYDDWYNSDEDEFLYEDSEGVLDIIENACKIVHQCVDYELFKEGYELADILLTAEIMVKGDYLEYANTPLYMAELDSKGLIKYEYRRLVLEALYCAYQSHSNQSRPEVLYRIICNSECDDITLENMMQDAKEDLEQQDEFLDAWICYLGERVGTEAEKYLKEAVALKNNVAKSLEYARRFFPYHPGIYEQIMLQVAISGNDEELFSIGQEALSSIQKQYLVRSRIALLAASASLRLGKQEEAEECWVEAFQSDTKTLHYLRLICESLDNSRHRECLKTVYVSEFEKAKKENNRSYQSGELRVNMLDNHSYYTIAFFDGEFQHVINAGMNVKEALGWSSTFMKSGIALFLLFLYQGEDLSAGCREMCENIVSMIGFSVEEYSKGLNHIFEMNNIELFWNLFTKWKKSMFMAEAEQESIISKLEKWIQMRVEGIMQKNRRNYYGECAAFVAALGEVRESRGEKNGKDYLLEVYRAQYSRRSAFQSELRDFGMKGRKK